MLTPKLQVTLETLRKLIRRGAEANVERILEKLHPADIAHLFTYLNEGERRYLVNLLRDPARAAEVFRELDPSMAVELLEELPPERVIEVLEEMPADDAAELIERLPSEMAEEVMTGLEREEAEDLEELLSYPEETAGRIMNPNCFSLHEETTVEEAIKAVQQASDMEMVFYIYIVDDRNHLVGVVSLRQLLTSPPGKRLREIMNTEVISVKAHQDQEEVARVVEKYNILAVPVVDEENKLLGFITVDDIIDVLRDEATEDLLKMGGARKEEFVYVGEIRRIVRLRLPWLVANLAGGLLTGYLMWLFKVTLQDFLYLVTFIPVIMGMGGNAGLQSSSIVVRGLALGRVDKGNLLHFWLRELRIGLLMGAICGGVAGAVGALWHGTPEVGLVVWISMTIAMGVACTMGTLMPFFFREVIHIDPAVASGPFVTTSNDITGILIYLGTATVLLKHML
ncbi:MAG: magnesium transporter [Deltaproteobacteria bacterium]|nr:MAG: magnesium transporter [Deltaproteobacteria bacterium]